MNYNHLKVGTDSVLHKKILTALAARKKLWYNKTANRRKQWERDLEIHQAFIPETEEDKLRAKHQEKTGVLEYVTIDIPYSYGLLMAFHTYLSSVFLARTPVLQYQERHGAGDTNVQAVEAIMDYQTNIGRHLVPYYIWLMDACKHGIGVVGLYWESETVRVSKIVVVEKTFGGFKIPGTKPQRVKRTLEVPGYQGNRMFNLRPPDFIFDTRVPVQSFQEGEFAGRLFKISWLDLSDGEQNGRYINIDKLRAKHIAGGGAGMQDHQRSLDESLIELPTQVHDSTLTYETPRLSIPDTGDVEAYELFVRLVPRNWELGKGKLSEKWVFTVANEIIIEARPFGELHDKFPYGVIETEIDGHALFKRSMLEIAEPLNHVMSWLVNTHFFNIRKTLNNTFVADPTKIVMDDFEDPEFGLMIRMRPEAYGQPIDSMIKQFVTADVTGTHIQDTKYIAEMMQQVIGVNSQLMGMLNSTGRKTATEVRGSTGFSMNRLKTQAEYISAMGFAPISQIMVQSTQQHLDQERRYRLTGDLTPGNATHVMVTPESITGFWDYAPIDGTMPVDKLALANLWKEIMLGVGQNEQLMAQYDIGSIFAHVAQLSGAKNINRFKIQTRPDEDIASDVNAGNLVPMGGNNGTRVSEETFNRPAGNIDGGLEDTAARVNDPKQISGVGPLS